MPKLVSDIGHIILQVGDMDEAVRLYCDILGFDLKERSPEWTVIATKLGELTLCKTHVVTPLVLGETSETPSAYRCTTSKRLHFSSKKRAT